MNSVMTTTPSNTTTAFQRSRCAWRVRSAPARRPARAAAMHRVRLPGRFRARPQCPRLPIALCVVRRCVAADVLLQIIAGIAVACAALCSCVPASGRSTPRGAVASAPLRSRTLFKIASACSGWPIPNRCAPAKPVFPSRIGRIRNAESAQCARAFPLGRQSSPSYVRFADR